MARDLVLVLWLFVDVLWSAFLFGGCAWLVFWHDHSPWWFLLAIFLSPALGGGKLYRALAKRCGLGEGELGKDDGA